MINKKIGLALGSGSVRGIAHIGVIKALMKEKIPIDYIAGTSAGAIVGALYCSDIDWRMLEKFVCHLKQKHLVDLTVPKKGLLEGKKAHEMLKLLTKNCRFADLKTPLAVTATDIENNQQVIMSDGIVADAVRASISIPGIFKPVIRGNSVLVDGAVLDRVPVGVVKQMGADIIIAVDVKGRKMKKGSDNYTIFDVIMNSIDLLEQKAFADCCAQADIAIFPDVEDVGTFNFELAEEYIQAGAEATYKIMPKIKQLLNLTG